MGGLIDAWVWIRTRVIQPRIVLLYLLLLTGLWISEYPTTITTSVQGSVTLLALLLVFRLWDDLADRTYDQNRSIEVSSQRILLNTQYIPQFYGAAVIALCLLAFIMYLFSGQYRFILYLTLCATLSLLYYRSSIKLDTRLTRELLLLLKYPVFVLLITETITQKTLIIATVIYALLLLHYLIERRLPKTHQ